MDYDVFVEFYDCLYSDLIDLDFYFAKAEQLGGPILELGCGTGRITCPLSKNFEVVGLDISAKMLKVAKKKCSARFIHGDMRTFDLNIKFPLILIPYRSFFHLNHSEKLLCLNSIKKHLTGELIIHGYILSEYEKSLYDWTKLDSFNGFDWFFKYTPPKSKYLIKRGPDSFYMDLFFMDELEFEELVEAAGLKLIDILYGFPISKNKSKEVFFVVA